VEQGHIPIFILMLLINRAHERSSRRQNLIDEDEDRLLGGQLDALADNVDELAHGQVGWHKVLLLVDGRDVAFLDLLADDGDTIGVLLTL
jgi:hypothetical protein